MKPKTEFDTASLAVIGVDIGKEVFHLVGLGVDGKIAFRRKIKIAHLPHDLARAVLDEARGKLEDAIDRMKTEAVEVPLIAVGGGAFLVPDRLAGVSQVIRVPHGDCANAVGAALAQISGETDQVYREMSREAAIAAAEAQAGDRAVAAGAERASVQTIDIEDMPIAYLPGNALRVRVRVSGAMRAEGRFKINGSAGLSERPLAAGRSSGRGCE
jgi:hypothetical protein